MFSQINKNLTIAKTNESDEYVVYAAFFSEVIDARLKSSPYEAMKEYYFRYHLKMNTEEIELDIAPELFSKLEIMSDELGITIDEVVNQILTDFMDEIGK
jgi:hypothetical protein